MKPENKSFNCQGSPILHKKQMLCKLLFSSIRAADIIVSAKPQTKLQDRQKTEYLYIEITDGFQLNHGPNSFLKICFQMGEKR